MASTTRDYWVTAWDFARAFARASWALIPAVGDRLVFIYQYYIGPRIPSGWMPAPLPGWFPWLFWGGMAVAVFQAFHQLRMRRDELEKRLQPKLRIVFRGSSRPYLQEWTHPGGIERTYRVGVENLSDATIEDVRVVIESCTPGQDFVFPAHMLRVMDVTREPGYRTISPTRRGKPTAFFDVVQERIASNGLAPDIGIGYLNAALLEWRLPLGEYEIVLLAEGGDAHHRARFIVTKRTPDARVVMRVIPRMTGKAALTALNGDRSHG